MSEELQDFGHVDLLDAEAIGKPGNRRFRLYARSRRGSAALWLEREQMEALSLAIDQLLAQIAPGLVLRAEAQAVPPATTGAPADFPDEPDIEFQVWQLQIGYDEERDVVVLRAAPLELIEQEGALTANEEVEPLFSATISRTHAERLSARIMSVLASGRPRCPFCGLPMEPAHVCEKQNGYHPVGLN